MIDLSIIIPVYNTEKKVLKKCLDSFSISDKLNYEIIIINDGSIRYSSEEYKKFIEKNLKGIKLNYIFKENGGVSSARNLGINAAKGKYITFVDSDDTFIFNNLNINSMLNNYDIIYYDIDIFSSKKHIFKRRTIMCGITYEKIYYWRRYQWTFFKNN